MIRCKYCKNGICGNDGNNYICCFYCKFLQSCLTSEIRKECKIVEDVWVCNKLYKLSNLDKLLLFKDKLEVDL